MNSEACYTPYHAENIPQGVDLWQIRLDCPDAQIEEFTSLLSSDEILRANRYVNELIRKRFIVARGAMRTILSSYAIAAPESLTFQYGSAGKPYLDKFQGNPLTFNLSHSGSLGILAVTDGRPLGVDLEQIHLVKEMDQLVTDYFSPRERDVFLSLSLVDKEIAFFKIWTRKEAYIKARGEGLGIPINHFSVSFLSNEPVRLVEVDFDPSEVEGWEMFHLDPCDGYVGALVIKR